MCPNEIIRPRDGVWVGQVDTGNRYITDRGLGAQHLADGLRIYVSNFSQYPEITELQLLRISQISNLEQMHKNSPY